ncbi:PAS/PAC sensor signal transduction histidine kinase [Halorubrum saccharovorum DSM 1137]|uniref:histidine kinase n=1 Tax=Halorubrum saccharovorum DSM 1137 TaxID=1227484 RepID=M0DT80_9EURY|nr:PAS domain-containing sensor histidine kinase [Halorubrum saccharovorum]ELZ38028.1 PAS/PAC sensor signal transduction histidine kinase [Halorubrum saccharovorum DSM 1137]
MDRDGEATPRVVRSFVEAIPTPTLACDPETHAIRAANAPAAELIGQDRGTLTLMGLTDLDETDETVDGDPVGAVVDDAVDREGVTEFEWETVDERGRRRLAVSLHATTIADERWLIVGLTDVTDRVTAEESLRSQLRVVDAVASTVPAALFQCSVDGTLARWNDRLAADAERDGEELSGTDLTVLFDDETRDGVAEALRRVYRDREPADCEATLLTRSGERVPYRLALGPIVDDGEVTGAIGVGEDRTEASLREERLAVLTRVLRHNFRNDLNVVTGFTERAIESVDDPDLATELERVVDTAERLLRVGETSRRVERLLSDRPAPTRLDLAEAVDEALISLPAELREGADIEVDVPEGVTVSAIGYLAEAITELVDNAIRHSEAERPRVEITAAELPSESWASLVVADDGPGIPPAERSVLTGEETPLEHASGLGLWYVNWIVSAGGGSFDIGSASAGGTRIEMDLRTPDDE